MAGINVVEKGCEGGTVVNGDELLETPASQSGALYAGQAGTAEVYGTDGAVAIDGEIADRGKVVEVDVFTQSRLHFIPGSAQLSVLQLQFNLMDL